MNKYKNEWINDQINEYIIETSQYKVLRAEGGHGRSVE